MHSQEKRCAFKLRLDSGTSVPKASLAEGISSSTGYRWRDQLQLEELMARHEDLDAHCRRLQAQHADDKVVKELLRRDKVALKEEKSRLQEEISRLRSSQKRRAILRWLANATGVSLLGDLLDAAWEVFMAWAAKPSSVPASVGPDGRPMGK